MKRNCCHNCFAFFLILSLSYCLNLKAQVDTLFINSNFSSANLKFVSLINKTSDISKTDKKDFYYFSFNNEYNTVDFIIKNKENSAQNIAIQFTYVFINEIVLSRLENNSLVPIYRTGIERELSTKPSEHRLFTLPIQLKPKEIANYQLKIKKEKGKPIATSILVKSEKTLAKHSFIQQIIIGSYFGISLLSVIFSLFIFSFLRKSTYLIYGAYIIFLGLFISSYIGVFSQLFLSENQKINKYTHYVLFSEVSLILFALFSQKILEAKTYMPKLKRFIDVFLVVLIGLRLLLHFLLNKVFENAVSLFMNIWYAIFLVLIVIIFIEIIIYYRKNNKRTSLFAFAYIFMIFGTFASILYHSYGLLETYFYDLPMLFYTSFLEILFLTFTVVFMVKDIYDERNILSEKIVIEERKNLTAFIKGEDEERKRIGKELHDNIGSKLSFLKRFVSDKFKDDEVTETIDTICNDVRNLSHEISPSDLKIVGFKNTVEDLTKTLSEQTSLRIEFSSFQFPEILNEDISVQLYRVIQEAFNNIFKHANAKHVDVQLIGHEDTITISLEDDGDGFDVLKAKTGLGIKNMQSRIQQIGGVFSLDSSLKKGTSILISVPK